METLFGNTAGLKAEQARSLRALYGRRVAREEFISAPLARRLTELSRDISRRIGLLITRQGKIEKVIIGEAHGLVVPDLGPRRGGAARFRGVRLVHTSLRPLGLTEDDLTDLALLQLDSVITISADLKGLPGAVQYAYLLPPQPDSSAHWRIEDIPSVHGWNDNWHEFITDLEAQFAKSPHLKMIEGAPGAILVGITLGDAKAAKRSLAELERLSDTAGLRVVDTVLQRRRRIDGRTCIGTGKLRELIIHSMHLGCEVLIFDRELSPSQLRNIATATDLKVLDRTQLILDIFAQHARTREGKLQVELAQLRYMLPRLAIMPTAMSRLTGGIGGRGPGETKLEINRRRAQTRLTRLERELSKLSKNRSLRRSRRKKNRVPVVGIVGYTNAGKSTLLNRLTRSDVLVENKLFATLDPTSRRFRTPREREILLTDTVGFIQDLPKTLFKAFKATLEEIQEADLILHVLDASDASVEHHMQSVNSILQQLDVSEHPILLVWNKIDGASHVRVRELLDSWGGLPISALNGQGVRLILEHVEDALFSNLQQPSKPTPDACQSFNKV